MDSEKLNDADLVDEITIRAEEIINYLDGYTELDAKQKQNIDDDVCSFAERIIEFVRNRE